MMGLIARAADHLANAGYEVAQVEVTDLSEAWRLWCDLISTERMSTLQLAQMREVGSPDLNGAINGMLEQATILDLEGYMKAIAHRSRVIRQWLAFLEAWPVILTPLSVNPTPGVNADLIGGESLRNHFWNDLRFCSAINVLGLPAAVVPIGLIDGHPVGAQLIASRYREDLCLDAAQAIENEVGVMSKVLWARDAG